MIRLGLLTIYTFLNFQQASRSLNLKDGEVKDAQFRIVSLQEDVNRLKKLVETSQVRNRLNMLPAQHD